MLQLAGTDTSLRAGQRIDLATTVFRTFFDRDKT